MTQKTQKLENEENYKLDVSYGKLYKYDKEKGCYVFVSSTSKRNKKSAIKEYEDYMLAESWNPAKSW